MRIFDGVCEAIEMVEAVGCQPIKIVLRGTYHKSTDENDSSRQSMCIYITSYCGGFAAVVGKLLPPLQSHAIEWARDWVRVIVALHHAIDKVEKPSLDGIRHHDSDRPITYKSSSHLFPSSLFCFLVLANQLSRFGYALPTLLETKSPFS